MVAGAGCAGRAMVTLTLLGSRKAQVDEVKVVLLVFSWCLGVWLRVAR